MKKFMKWFLMDSNVKWVVLAGLVFLSIMIYNGEMVGICAAIFVLLFTFVGVGKSWWDLKQLEKEGKIKL